jgi:hypothetical protein
VSLPDPKHSRAILIGTSHYRDPNLPDLPAVANNLVDLAKRADGTRWHSTSERVHRASRAARCALFRSAAAAARH